MLEFNLDETWDRVFAEEIEETRQNTNIPSAQWRSGGRVSKEKPNKEDANWWYDAGQEFCENWIDWRNESRWRIWEVNGQPAIEIGGTVNVLGKFPLKCYIDRIFVTPAGELVVLDLKSGARSPDSDFQLGLYACWVEAKFGVRPPYGCYWNARKGEVSPPFPLDLYTQEYVGAVLEMLKKAKQHEIYIPNVGEHCKRCGVAKACYSVGGEDSHLYDPLDPSYGRGLGRRPTIDSQTDGGIPTVGRDVDIAQSGSLWPPLRQDRP